MLKTVGKGVGRIARLTGVWKDPQKWLNEKYPTPESKAEVEKIVVKEDLGLYGSLSFQGFFNLKELDIIKTVTVTTLDLTACPELRVLKCQVVDNLKLTDCLDLEELDCSGSTLTNLKFLTKLNLEKLRILDIYDNSFSRSNLAVFAHFVNLEVLIIGGCSTIGPLKTFNHFVDSLEPLKNLTKLCELNIDCTDIDSGLEYLPDSLEEFSYSLEDRLNESKRESAQVKKIAEQLAPYDDDLKEWQVAHPELMIKAQPQKFLEKFRQLEQTLLIKEQELQMEREETEKALYKAQEWRERQLKELEAEKNQQIQRLQDKITQLESQLELKIEILPK